MIKIHKTVNNFSYFLYGSESWNCADWIHLA
jgi:hypothetical protein